MSKFEFIKNEIEGLVVVKQAVFGDDRGFFMETYHKQEFAAAGIKDEFVQDNHSKSTKGVLRGLHFQTENTQGKLVRVINGEVYDVAVDCRPSSKTFGKWFGITLSEENKLQFYIPKGFAHGFLVLSDRAEFVYKCTDVYNPNAEGGIPYNDDFVGVEWPCLDCPIQLSEKDKHHKAFKEQAFENFLRY
ncbi:MAG: dTDP-4-dehydrorhamnose 3,5-epimerase [Oscillospiraceae bacterium]